MRPAFLTTAETVALLGIPERTFRREYQRLFTDGRPVHRRKRRVPLAFRRAEVEGVIQHGWEWLAAERAMTERRRKLTK